MKARCYVSGMTSALTTIQAPVEFGPAMTSLNERQRAFVIALNNSGLENATQAARLAGYSQKGASVTAHRLMHSKNIQDAIREDARARLASLVPGALRVLQDTIDNETHPDRLKAALSILNRTGINEVMERNVKVEVTMTTDQKLARIGELAEKLGLDPKVLLGNVEVPVVDAEFEEVKEPSGLNGLEGLV